MGKNDEFSGERPVNLSKPALADIWANSYAAAATVAVVVTVTAAVAVVVVVIVVNGEKFSNTEKHSNSENHLLPSRNIHNSTT